MRPPSIYVKSAAELTMVLFEGRIHMYVNQHTLPARTPNYILSIGKKCYYNIYDAQTKMINSTTLQNLWEFVYAQKGVRLYQGDSRVVKLIRHTEPSLPARKPWK